MCETFICEECNLTFTKKKYLLRHQENHSEDRPFQCSFCEKCFKRGDHLRRHLLSHSTEKPYACDKCQASFRANYMLRRHIKRSHTLENFPYVCQQCETGFHKKMQLKKHTALHTGIPPFECDQCDKRYYSNSRLNEHRKKKHDGRNESEPPKMIYYCPECEDSFDCLASFTHHKTMMHSVMYPCTYPDCLKEYTRRSSLRNHIRGNHIFPDRFCCSICDQKFGFKHVLENHISKVHHQSGNKDPHRRKRQRTKTSSSISFDLMGKPNFISNECAVVAC